MAQSGFTPIKIYSSTTAAAVPTAGNLEQGELAINTNDGKLFYEDSSGVVQVIATKAGATGSVTSVGGTGTVNGITLTGTVTTSGNLTLGGTLSGVSLTSQVSGVLPIANGGTNATTVADARTSLDVPSRGGSGASGTWGINISGNAATATSASTATSAATLTTARLLWGQSFNGSANLTGPVRPNGGTSIDLPSFASNLDVSTGIWFPGGADMAFVTGSNRELSVQSTNVFIGTSVSAIGSSQIGTQFSGRGTRLAISNNSATSSIDLYRAVDGSMLNFIRGSSTVGYIFSNSSSTIYSTSSDYRLKKDVVPVSNALAKLCALNPVQWKWKSSDTIGEGFIAHELAEHFPQAVAGKKDAVDAEGKPIYQGVDSSFLVASLVSAVKELSSKVDQLQAEIAALKA